MDDPQPYDDIPVAPVWYPPPSAPPAPESLEITISQCLTDLEIRVDQQNHCGRKQIMVDMNQGPYAGRQAGIIQKYKTRNPNHTLKQDPADRILIILW